MDISALGRMRTASGDPLVIFAGPSVTTTLPFGRPEDVRREVTRIIDTLVDACSLFILPANNILPDCPVENIIAMHQQATTYRRGDR